jgi:hypothetical protein
MKMQIINLTPHEINLIVDDGATMAFPPQPESARCDVNRQAKSPLRFMDKNIPVNSSKFGTVIGLPEPELGKIFIVSRIIAEALPERRDLYYPDELVRNEVGKIIGCRSLGVM